MKKLSLLFIFFGCLSIGVLAQEALISPNYSAFRINAQLNNYFKGETSDEFGADKIEPLNILSWSAGLDFLPKISKNVYGVLGFHLSREPLCSYIENPSEELAGSDYLPMAARVYGFYSFSIPIGFGIQSPLRNKKMGLLFECSFVPMYYPPGGTFDFFIIANGDTAKDNNGFKAFTTQDGWYYQSRVSGGVNFNTNYGKITTRLVWNKTFQNLMEGDYSFNNENGEVVSGGKYALSGSYIGLAVGYSMLHRTNRNRPSLEAKKAKRD